MKDFYTLRPFLNISNFPYRLYGAGVETTPRSLSLSSPRLKRSGSTKQRSTLFSMKAEVRNMATIHFEIPKQRSPG